MLHVTQHAIDRYRERVNPDCSEEEAHAALSTDAIRAASEFGCEYVRLATGHRIVLRGYSVVTVQPPTHYKRQIGRFNLGYVKRFRKRRHDAKAT